MPRDLASETKELPVLTRESGIDASEEQGSTDSKKDADRSEQADRVQLSMQKSNQFYGLHPYGAMLNINDVESCVLLENAAFENPEHRCTREKFIYRLTQCPELCSGTYISVEPDSPHTSAETAPAAHLVQSGSSRKQVLIGHIIATKSTNQTIQDEDMEMPPNWREVSTLAEDGVGHREHGRTLCVHSVAVLPRFKGIGVGKTMLRDYIAKMFDHNVADRIAIITYEDLVPYYERFGFKNLGPSKASYGGGGWFDMVYDFMNRRRQT